MIFKFHSKFLRLKNSIFLNRFCTDICKISHSEQIKTDENLERETTITKMITEVEMFNFQSKCDILPEKITASHWDNILTLKTKSARLRYYQYLTKVESIKEKKRLKKTMNRGLLNKCPENQELKVDPYKKICLQTSDQVIAQFRNTRLIHAMMHGQKLVIDCSYDQEMSLKEIMSTTQQLTRVFGHNRLSHDPFDIHLCGVDMTGILMKHLRKCIPTVLDKKFPLHIHEHSYLQHFPKENLVYLSPHCENELMEFNHNDIYIIGAITDKVKQKSLSVLKAKRDGLRVMKLPLENYLKWKRSSFKALAIDQVLQILLEIKESGDWEKAILHVPTRKFVKKEPLT